MAWVCMPACRPGTVIYDFTDESYSMKGEVYRSVLCVHIHYLLGQLSQTYGQRAFSGSVGRIISTSQSPDENK